MLISKGYSAGDVVCFKIVNGDEVLATLSEETDSAYVIKKPCTVIPSQQGLGLLQTMISADINTTITLSKSHVIMHSPVVKDIENHYIHTTTGIQPVKNGIIT